MTFREWTRRLRPALALSGVALLLAACAVGVSLPNDDPLAGTQWRLTHVGFPAAPDPALSPDPMTGGPPLARFTPAGHLTGWTGCNTYGAIYTVRDVELRLDDLVWTEAGCPDPEPLGNALFRQEQRFKGVLRHMESFALEGDTLTLRGSGGEALVFHRDG